MKRLRRRRAVALVALAAVAFAALTTWHYATLYRSAVDARTALLAIEDSLAVGLDAGAADLERIDGRLAEARTAVDRARWHFGADPLILGARWLPAVGDQVVAADAFLDAAHHLVAAGEEAVVLGGQALDARGRRAVGEPVTATALELLEAAGPSLARIEGHVADAVAARRTVGDRELIGPLDDARTQLDEQLPRIAELTRRAGVARAVLPKLMGFEGSRRYLLLSLNNGELMPGGGLVTAAGILTVEDGHVTQTTFRNAATWLPAYREAGGDFIPAPEPLQRHLLKDYPWNLGVASWDPDFPTWARLALEFYELAWGPQDVDGIVAVDLQVLRALLAITGAQTVEAPGFGEVRLTSDNAVIELERVTRAPSDTWRRSKEAVGALQEALLRDVLALPAERWDELAAAIREAGDERHLQVLLFDEGAQGLVDELGWAGRLDAPGGDFLHVSEASVNSTKLNLVFAPDATYVIEVDALGTAQHRLVLRYENTMSAWARGRDPDLVSHLMFDGQYGAYVRAFVPPDATGFAGHVDGAPAAVEDAAATSAHRWFGIYLAVPADATRELTLEWSVPLATTDADTYTLALQKQSGTDGLCMDLRIQRDGRAARLDVSGGTTDEHGRVCLTTDVQIRATLEAGPESR
ncbi:MAG: DUF4012 domain-containing protein [Dehalococcoidia bacterium]